MGVQSFCPKFLSEYLIKVGRQDLLTLAGDMLKKKDDIFQTTLAERVKLMPNCKDCLERLKAEGFLLGIDSSTTAENVKCILVATNLEKYFDIAIGGDLQVEQKWGEMKKKDSRIKFSANQLNIPLSSCLAIGDSPKDMDGASGAGVRTIAVPNNYTRGGDFSKASYIVNSLFDITPKLVESLLSYQPKD